MSFREFYDLMQVGFQMDDWTLSAAIRQFGMVRSVYDVEHDRSWTEVERYAITHAQVLVAIQRHVQTQPFNFSHSNSGAVKSTSLRFRIGPQIAICDDRGQAVHVDDVVYLRLLRYKHEQPSVAWYGSSTDIRNQRNADARSRRSAYITPDTDPPPPSKRPRPSASLASSRGQRPRLRCTSDPHSPAPEQ